MSATLSAFGTCTAETLAVLADADGVAAGDAMIWNPVRIVLGHTRTRSGTRALERLLGVGEGRDERVGFRRDPDALDAAASDGWGADAMELAPAYDDHMARGTGAGGDGLAGLRAAHRVLHDAGFVLFLD